jgi:CarD family transcriptional regulator
MSTRKKATKKSASRPSKAIKQSAKSSASRKSKDAKISATKAKPVRTAKKAAAKVAKTAKVSGRAPATSKAKALRAKSSRIAAAAKSSARPAAKRKAVSPPKLQKAVRAAKATSSQSKARKIISAAKKKSESVKKGQDRLSAKIQSKTVQSKLPAVDDSQANLREAPKVVLAPAAVIELETAATPKPLKAAIAEKPTTHEAEEAIVQKAVKSSPRQGFKTNEFVVYPAHGVGQIVAIEEQEVAGFRLELFVITFVKDKMTLRVPTGKVAGVGMRKLAEPDAVKRSLDILLGRARVKRTMWSRRAQEYETKINSGDLTAIAEVVRDLYRSEAQPEQSYSERQLYEAALDRMAREVAVVQKLTESEALKAIDAQLQKSQRRGGKAELDAAASGAGDSDVEEAA